MGEKAQSGRAGLGERGHALHTQLRIATQLAAKAPRQLAQREAHRRLRRIRPYLLVVGAGAAGLGAGASGGPAGGAAAAPAWSPRTPAAAMSNALGARFTAAVCPRPNFYSSP